MTGYCLLIVMDQAEIEAALQAAFRQCEAAGHALNQVQKQVLLQAVETLTDSFNQGEREPGNPLDELTPDQRQALLQFVAEQEQEDLPWKTKLLNDWLQGRDSGAVQFIRDRYGLQWLDKVKPSHLTVYQHAGALGIKVGDRLEVSNSLWEWIPDAGTASREWYPCTVTGIFQIVDAERSYVNCTVRLENGLEYDINGMYDWNRYNWRWPQD